MNGSYQKSLTMNHNILLSRVFGGACGMAAGFACGMRVNDEFLTLAFGVMGAFLGLSMGFVRSLVLALAVVLGVHLFMM
ncbi:hypothetical protein [Salidesulfovibrio onnuriiensis]|uniref:hypothetical protein n=1 Tax=Salidesulfovibrio onnuriiensis TaxID=2583823 RepID=UPI0011C90901|nr:hypothetical protein [Salidesulfovibrio onnuriiensis]